MIQDIERQMEMIKASSKEEYARRFIVANDGSVILHSEIERYNELVSIQSDYLKFHSNYGDVIRTYEDTYYKTLGLNGDFEAFLAEMQKHDVTNAEVIHEYLVYLGRLKEISSEPAEAVLESTTVQEQPTEETESLEPAQLPENVEKKTALKVTPGKKYKVLKTEKVHRSTSGDISQEEEETLTPPSEEAAEIIDEAPIMAAPFGPAVYDPSTPLVIPEELVDSEDELIIPNVPTAEDLGITEDSVHTEPEIVDITELNSQIAEKKSQIATLKKEAKEMKLAKKRAVWRRRKYNWHQGFNAVIDFFPKMGKKAVALKGVRILENTSERTQGYRDLYFKIENFYASYKNRAAEVNMEEIKELNQAIGHSADLTIEEKTRLYKKLQKLARKVEKVRSKTAKESSTPLSEEDITNVLNEGEALLTSFGR